MYADYLMEEGKNTVIVVWARCRVESLCAEALNARDCLMQDIRKEFSWVPDADDVEGRCLLDLGEDRRLTTCLLRAGHEPTFCKQATAGARYLPLAPHHSCEWELSQMPYCVTEDLDQLDAGMHERQSKKL